LGIAFGTPRYVVSIEPETRRVVIGEKEDLGRMRLTADRLNWLVPQIPDRFRALAKIRYRNEPAPAEVRLIEDDLLQVEFDEPQYGVAPGQAVVLYDENRVLGGGWIR
jgi:tRNA-specific 2-thiouridylase